MGAITETFIATTGLQEGAKYLDGVKTIEGDEFQELLDDLEELDECIDELIGEDEDEVTEEDAARLKAAIRALQLPGEGMPDEAPVPPWKALCAMLRIPESGHAVNLEALPTTLGDALKALSARQSELQQLEKQHADTVAAMEAELAALRTQLPR